MDETRVSETLENILDKINEMLEYIGVQSDQPDTI